MVLEETIKVWWQKILFKIHYNEMNREEDDGYSIPFIKNAFFEISVNQKEMLT